MITVEVNNSECKIEGLDTKQHRQVSDLLSYTLNPTAHFFSGGYGPKKQSLLSKKGVFPTGVLYVVKAWAHKHKVAVKYQDLRVKPAPQPGLFASKLEFTPYEDQTDAADAALKHGRGIIVAPTGVGKSVIIAMIIQRLSVPTMVVVPNLELKRQLTEFLRSVFGAGKVGVDKLIYVENIDSVPFTMERVKYDCVIIDEFHHSGAKTYRSLNKKVWNTVYYKFGVTATPFRSQDNERLLLESVLSNTIFKISYERAVEMGYIVPMEAYYVDVPKTTTSGTTWHQVYSDLVVNNEERNKMIAHMLRVLKGEHQSTLCLVKEIAHGQKLSEMASVMFANGQDNDSADMIKFFSQDKIKCLIGTSGILGEGVDTKPAEFIIIAGLGKSKNQFMQQVGRGFRRFGDKSSCKIILFNDSSHKWTKEHFKAQCRILKEEYGLIPSKINF